MRIKIIILSLVSAILIATFLFNGFACKSLTKKPANELIVAVEELPNNLIPVRAMNDAGRLASGIIFQALFDPSGEGLNDFEPTLAKEIVQDRDNRAVYNVYLRKEIKWHDGREFTADDVRFSYDCYITNSNKSPFRARIMSSIKKLEVLEKYQLKITFNIPVSPADAECLLSFKIIPSSFRGTAMDKDLFSSIGLKFGLEPIGTGPYKFESSSKNKLILARASDFVSIEKVIIQEQREPEVKVRKFIDKKIDIIYRPCYRKTFF